MAAIVRFGDMALSLLAVVAVTLLTIPPMALALVCVCVCMFVCFMCM